MLSVCGLGQFFSNERGALQQASIDQGSGGPEHRELRMRDL